jgi:hypothetical protein
VIKKKNIVYIEYFKQSIDLVSQVIFYTEGAIDPPAKVKFYMENLLAKMIAVLDVNNLICSCELIESTDGELMVIDMNTRFSGIWKRMLLYRKGAETLFKNLLGHILDDSSVELLTPSPFLRRLLDFPAGVVKDVEWFVPNIEGTVALMHHERLQEGCVISAARRNLAPLVMISCESLEECFNVYEQIMKNTKITYS